MEGGHHYSKKYSKPDKALYLSISLLLFQKLGKVRGVLTTDLFHDLL